ncbi:MAG: DUF2634 domain-containing protein [Brevinema sp.]
MQQSDCDIRILDGELALTQGDFELVEENECLLQDIRNKLITEFGSLFYDKKYGIGILRYIHNSQEELTLLKLKQEILHTLKQDHRIHKDSIDILITPTIDQLSIQINISTKCGQKLSLKL